MFVKENPDREKKSTFCKGIRVLLCVIDILIKYAWVVPLKDKKGVTIVNAFQKILDDSQRKPNKIWIDKGKRFYNSSFKKGLKDKGIEMNSTNNEGESVVAERFIRTLKSKIYKYMTSTSKNVYIDKLNDIVNEYNNTYHRKLKWNLLRLKIIHILILVKKVNEKDPKFKIGDHFEISKYKNSFAKGYTPNWSEEAFLLNEIKNAVPWAYVISDFNDEEIIGTFYEKELQNANQKEFSIEKVIKKKGDKLYVK